METETAFVRANRTIELETIAGIRMGHAIVVFPDYAERKHALRLNHAGQKIHFFILRMRFHNGCDGG